MRIAIHDSERETIKHKTFPNYALMKISAYHKSLGDTVERFVPTEKYDKVYSSKVFDFTPENPYLPPDTIKGGTGYDVKSKLPSEIENCYPDYSIYPECDYAIGYITRGCPNHCRWCVVPEKEGNIQPYRTWRQLVRSDTDKLVLMDNNILACDYGINQLESLIGSGYRIDLNQGMDARLVTDSIARILSKLQWIRHIRFSCDSTSQIDAIFRAAELLQKYGVKPYRLFVYLLVTDDLENAAHRVNELKKLKGINIYAQAERNVSKGIVPNKQQLEFAQRYVYSGKYRSETWQEYCDRKYTIKEDKQMAKKHSFDTAILKDIKSVAGDSFTDNIKMLPVEQLHNNPENFYDLSDLDTLVEDIDRQGLKTPLYVVPNEDNGYTVISGHRRKAAVQELIDSGKYGTDKLPCYIGVKKNEAETMLDLIMLNASTRVISDAETVKQCEKLEEVFKQLEADGKKVQGRMRDKIAAALNVSPAQVGKVENIRHNAIDEVKAAVNEGKMSISTANEVAKLEPQKQKDLIEKKKPEKITHKEIKNTVTAAKEKVSPKKQDVSIEKINEIPEADLDFEGGFEDMTLDDYNDNSTSDDKAVIMPTAEKDAELREKAKAAAEAMKELWVKPPEYFNNIVDSGMCNSIISGYVLLVLEEMGIERPSNIFKIINGVLDFQNAQAARNKFSDN